jgi:hypothetical protein
MDRLEAECIGISSEFGKLGFDLCPDLGRLGLRPTREQVSAFLLRCVALTSVRI